MSISNGLKAASFLGAIAGGLLTASGAFAHAQLVSADPSPNANEIGRASCRERKFSNFKLTDVDGTEVKISAVDMKDAKILAAKPASPLTPGLYTISWTAVGDDSHKLTGTFSFTVK